MKKTRINLLQLVFALLVAFFFSISFLQKNVSASEEEKEYQEVETMTVLSQYSNEKGLYLDMPTTIDSGVPSGTWSERISSVEDVITINGKTLTELNIPFQLADPSYRLHIGYGDSVSFEAGDVIVIPFNTVIPAQGKNDIKLLYEYTITFNGTSFTLTYKSSSFKEYEVDSIIVNVNSTTNSKAFILFADSEGNNCDLGYNAWVDPDAYTNDFASKITCNGEVFSTIEGATIQGMDISNALCFNGYYLPVGASIVINEGTVFENGCCKLTFGRTFTITWNGESYDATRSYKELTFPEYEMEEGMLSDFTKSSIYRLGGQSYLEAVSDPTTWGVNYTGLVSGSFVSADEVPFETTNGGYKFGWETTEGLLYPSIMFKFRNDISFENDDELVFRIYFSETLDMSFTLWMTSVLTPNIWDAQDPISGMTLKSGEFNEIRVSISNYLDENGNLAPICFTYYYAGSFNSNDDVPGGYTLFDTVYIRKSVKVTDENYKASDISEIIPLTKEKSYVGERDEYTEDFDYEKDCNIAFIRTDKVVSGIKTKVTISKVEDFSFYFVLNGVSKYYLSGGVYYWFNDSKIRVGTATKLYIDENLPESIKDNEAFIVELMCQPYYVDGIKTGNYIGIKINGEQLGENAYVPNASCNFGNYFGLYLHNTTKNTTITVAPVEVSSTSPIELKLSTSLNATSLKINETLGTRVKMTGKMYNSGDIEYAIVSGSEYAEIDEEGFITGKANGKATIVAFVENEFGKFESNQIELTIGTGVSQEQKDEQKDEKSILDSFGCQNSVCLSVFGITLLLGTCAVLKNKKENY